MSAAFAPATGGVLVRLRVTPNAGADRIEGIETRADGHDVLRLRVRAVPDRGRANAAAVALIAGMLGVPPSAVELVSGATARLKTVRVIGDSDDFMARIAAFLAEIPPSR